MTQTEDIILHAENFLKFQKQFQPTPVTASSGFYETVNILDKEFSKIYPDETFENFAAIKMLWGYDYPDEYKKQLFEEFLRRGGLPALDEIEA